MRTKTFIIALLVLGALQVRAQVNNVSAFSQKLQEREQKKKDEVKALEDLLVQYKALVSGLVKLKKASRLYQQRPVRQERRNHRKQPEKLAEKYGQLRSDVYEY